MLDTFTKICVVSTESVVCTYGLISFFASCQRRAVIIVLLFANVNFSPAGGPPYAGGAVV